MKTIRNALSKVKTSGIRRALMLSLSLMLVMLLAAPVFAGEVTYQGQADGFVFAPGGTSSPTNIFEDLTDLMPGDTATESITVKNTGSNAAKIYIKATDPEKGGTDFLSKLKMKVDVKGGAKLFEASADQKAGLADWRLIGELQPGGSADLDVTVEVPIELGNEYQDQVSYVNWQFQAEEDDPEPDEDEEPADEDDPSDGDEGTGTIGRPKTGDSLRPLIWAGVLLAAILILIAVKKLRK